MPSARPDASLGVSVDRLTDDGAVINGVLYKGPVISVNGKVLMWNVPQYGKGGPVTEEGAEARGASSGRDSLVPGTGGLFDGWSTDAFKVFEVLEQPPGALK
ncbi:hypothetical protein HDU93_002255 [Gonapodya sp. JEL0774]|nr:hypothetical protein HDU93_002255 [Gonapodya sp. JEL0774]